ncbi:MAG: hypothetical protein FJ146_20005 [Deltaproteobacteria bacterium]|nr:hypothetical protein [Deltaproteobacteria bacterium]
MPTKLTKPTKSTNLSLSQSTRVILAFLGFATLIAAGMIAAFGLEISPLRGKIINAGGRDDDESGGFFYRSVGSIAASMAATKVEPKPTPEALYTVELAVFEQKEEAETLVAALQAQGNDAYYTPLNHQGHVIYRVRRGLFPTEAEAEKAALAMRGQGQKGASVVSLQ